MELLSDEVKLKLQKSDFKENEYDHIFDAILEQLISENVIDHVEFICLYSQKNIKVLTNFLKILPSFENISEEIKKSICVHIAKVYKYHEEDISNFMVSVLEKNHLNFNLPSPNKEFHLDNYQYNKDHIWFSVFLHLLVVSPVMLVTSIINSEKVHLLYFLVYVENIINRNKGDVKQLELLILSGRNYIKNHPECEDSKKNSIEALIKVWHNKISIQSSSTRNLYNDNEEEVFDYDDEEEDHKVEEEKKNPETNNVKEEKEQQNEKDKQERVEYSDHYDAEKDSYLDETKINEQIENVINSLPSEDEEEGEVVEDEIPYERVDDVNKENEEILLLNIYSELPNDKLKLILDLFGIVKKTFIDDNEGIHVLYEHWKSAKKAKHFLDHLKIKNRRLQVIYGLNVNNQQNKDKEEKKDSVHAQRYGNEEENHIESFSIYDKSEFNQNKKNNRVRLLSNPNYYMNNMNLYEEENTNNTTITNHINNNMNNNTNNSMLNRTLLPSWEQQKNPYPSDPNMSSTFQQDLWEKSGESIPMNMQTNNSFSASFPKMNHSTDMKKSPMQRNMNSNMKIERNRMNSFQPPPPPPCTLPHSSNFVEPARVMPNDSFSGINHYAVTREFSNKLLVPSKRIPILEPNKNPNYVYANPMTNELNKIDGNVSKAFCSATVNNHNIMKYPTSTIPPPPQNNFTSPKKNPPILIPKSESCYKTQLMPGPGGVSMGIAQPETQGSGSGMVSITPLLPQEKEEGGIRINELIPIRNYNNPFNISAEYIKSNNAMWKDRKHTPVLQWSTNATLEENHLDYVHSFSLYKLYNRYLLVSRIPESFQDADKLKEYMSNLVMQEIGSTAEMEINVIYNVKTDEKNLFKEMNFKREENEDEEEEEEKEKNINEQEKEKEEKEEKEEEEERKDPTTQNIEVEKENQEGTEKEENKEEANHNNKNPPIYAHITFKTMKMCLEVKKILEKNKMVVVFSSPFKPSNTLWVGNMLKSNFFQIFNILKTMFHYFGEISNLKYIADKNCFFVQYKNIQDAVKARNHMYGIQISSNVLLNIDFCVIFEFEDKSKYGVNRKKLLDVLSNTSELGKKVHERCEELYQKNKSQFVNSKVISILNRKIHKSNNNSRKDSNRNSTEKRYEHKSRHMHREKSRKQEKHKDKEKDKEKYKEKHKRSSSYKKSKRNKREKEKNSEEENKSVNHIDERKEEKSSSKRKKDEHYKESSNKKREKESSKELKTHEEEQHKDKYNKKEKEQEVKEQTTNQNSTTMKEKIIAFYVNKKYKCDFSAKFYKGNVDIQIDSNLNVEAKSDIKNLKQMKSTCFNYSVWQLGAVSTQKKKFVHVCEHFTKRKNVPVIIDVKYTTFIVPIREEYLNELEIDNTDYMYAFVFETNKK